MPVTAVRIFNTKRRRDTRPGAMYRVVAIKLLNSKPQADNVLHCADHRRRKEHLEKSLLQRVSHDCTKPESSMENPFLSCLRPV